MRFTVICGLDHVEPAQRNHEVARLLTDLAEQVRTQGIALNKPIVMNDVLGNRVGVCDLFGPDLHAEPDLRTTPKTPAADHVPDAGKMIATPSPSLFVGQSTAPTEAQSEAWAGV